MYLLLPFIPMATLTTTGTAGLTAALIIASAGGTAVLAESAVPGDTLYPVKTSVNETLMGSVALSTSAEAEFRSDLAVRRLDEAIKLAEDSELTSTVRIDLQQKFESNASTAVSLAADAANNNDANAAADVLTGFSNEIQQSIEMMNNIDATTEQRGQLSIMIATAESVSVEADAKADSYAQVEAADAETESESSANAEGSTTIEADARDAAATSVDSAQNALEELQVQLDAAGEAAADVRADVEVQVEEAITALDNAQQSLREKAYDSAESFATEARDITSRARAEFEATVNSVQNQFSSVGAEVSTEAEATVKGVLQ